MTTLFRLEEKNTKPWVLNTGWMHTNETQYWLSNISETVDWIRPIVNVYGKEHKIPRLTCFIGEQGISYSYSGLTHIASGWPDWFYPLADKVAKECKVNFNGCLLNLYRDGSDCMGWHADDEPEIDQTRPIASLSLGSARDFILKKRDGSLREVLKLSSGDLLIMLPKCQEDWLHSVPVRKRNYQRRINLTFRQFITLSE